jgi:hypothetical protein
MSQLVLPESFSQSGYITVDGFDIRVDSHANNLDWIFQINDARRYQSDVVRE